MTDKPTAEILDTLYAVVEARRGGDPEASYTAKLFARGGDKIAEKVGEEAIETIVAALKEGPDALASESADLLYHLCVLWADAGVRPEDVWAKLAAREGVSGLTEKANREK
ncbi:MAG: phosphoribosyl-ATP diphosphatase [Alphaproteobacteria bacterium]|nr:phosphoribosyl-ATP diphosphatase [Alphaproteobacteria bacterium]